MNFPTNILSIFAKKAGDQSPADGRLSVPNILQPVLEIPEGVAFTDNVIAVDGIAKQTSFIRNSFINSTNQAAQSFAMAILAPGVWEVDFVISAWANWASTSSQASMVIQFNGSPTATTFYSFTAVAANQRDSQSFRLRLAHQVDAVGLQIQIGTVLTGVGQTTEIRIGINARRLG